MVIRKVIKSLRENNAMQNYSAPAELFHDLPESLHETVDIYWQRWSQACDSMACDAGPATGLTLAQLGHVWACSDFVARTCIRYPATLHDLLDEGLQSAVDIEDHTAVLEAMLSGLGQTGQSDNTQLRQQIRQYRQKNMLRIALRDLLQLAPIETLLQEQSDLANAIIDSTLRHLHGEFCVQLGVPRDTDGIEQRLIVLAMGKLGGDELNFSSDIDLIFCYPSDGKTDGRGGLSNHEFFVRVIRQFVPLLDDVTEDGFVFRVDTRLRPYGSSGPLAMSFNALENYYQSQGREWERYAMIKAHAVSGNRDDIKALTQILRPFVYRRYLDYSVFAGIRAMKTMIEEQVRRKSMQGNIKLGKGGIREIEFIGQTFQLIRGGRDARLQSRSILTILQCLAQQEILSQQDVDQLVAAYRHLRMLENRLQIENDQQVYELPAATLSQQRLMQAMRISNWQYLLNDVEQHTDNVQQIFARLIEEPDVDEQEAGCSLIAILQHYFVEHEIDSDAEHLRHELYAKGVSINNDELSVLEAFKRSPAMRNATEQTRELCISLLNAFFTEINVSHASETLQRLIDIMQAVMGRPVYLSMMMQYVLLRQRVIWLCQTSQWFVDQIRSMPILLDELLEGGSKPALPTREELEMELESKVRAVPERDFELLLDSLRVFKQANVFKVAMLDVVAEHKVTDLADRLSDIAELLVAKALQLAWQEMAARYGTPGCTVEGEELQPGLGVIAYGKLGGAELGYASDLDVVFVHNSRGKNQHTNGDRQLENSAFFGKVVQRFLHILGTRTFSGVLYEIDTRLRPDGRAGLMVSSVEAFEHYQQSRAWTWEHQALVRARFVAGDNQVAQEFDRIRRSVLSKSRDWSTLAKDVCEMRAKMREHLGTKGKGVDLKQDAGGLVDIEFITQAGVLWLAPQRPVLLDSTATLVLLSELTGAAWLNSNDFEKLYNAYVLLRRAHNHKSLKASNADLQQQCEQAMWAVSLIWQRIFAEYDAADEAGNSE